MIRSASTHVPLPSPHESTREAAAPRPRSVFYLVMALILVGIVIIGFSQTLDVNLIHAPSPRPGMLYLHIVFFVGWVLLFMVQAVLVRCRRVAWHRRLGLCGLVLGAGIPVIGMETALIMTRLHHAEGYPGGEAFLMVSCFDMLAFAVTFWLAMYWRRRPEYHRRLMLMASCGLMSAAFARFPSWLMPSHAWYVCIDLLILVAAIRDWVLLRRVHPVYLYGLPLLALGQAAAMWVYLSKAPAWISIARWLLG